MGTDFWLNMLDVVTSFAGFLPATKRRELPLVFPNRRGRESAARAGIIKDIHRVSEDKEFPCRLARQGINNWV
ncbi:hypothetical protein CWD08_25725 [Salmonella enterica]|nr:hypothetical protein [Salmonella enterica]